MGGPGSRAARLIPRTISDMIPTLLCAGGSMRILESMLATAAIGTALLIGIAR